MKFLLILFFFIFVIKAYANIVLTWNDCVEETTRYNKELLAAQSKLISSSYLVKSAEGNNYPQLSGNMNAQKKINDDTTKDSYGASISVTQNLFSGFQNASIIKKSKANNVVAEADLELVKAKVSFDLKSAFQNLQYAQDYLKLTKDITKRREQNLKLVELKFESGIENKGSVLLAKALLEQAKLDVIQAKNLINIAQQQLTKALGRDIIKSSILEIFGDVPVSEPEILLDLNKLVQMSPERKKALAQEEFARASVKSAESEFYPKLDLKGEIVNQGDEFLSNENEGTVGLTLSVPIFAGGKNYYSAKSETELLKIAMLNRENLDRDIVVRLKQAYSDFIESVQRVKVDKTFYEATETRAKIGTEKYNNGLLSFDDWNNIENERITKAKDFLQSKKDRVLKEAAWEQILGKGVIK